MIVKEGERLDDLHRNGYKIIQNPGLFCFGQDAVLLSAFAVAKKGERALDLCTGNGIVPILMCARNQGATFDAVEIQPESAELARRSVEYNKLEDIIKVTIGDLRKDIFPAAHFDVVTVNPPYMNENGGIVNATGHLAIARHEIMCTLDDVLSASSRLLKFGGRFYMIHRPSRLVDIFYGMRYYKLEPKRLRLVCPKAGREPVMALIEGGRGGNPLLKTLPPLYIYNDEGGYTDEVMDIYYG